MHLRRRWTELAVGVPEGAISMQMRIRRMLAGAATSRESYTIGIELMVSDGSVE